MPTSLSQNLRARIFAIKLRKKQPRIRNQGEDLTFAFFRHESHRDEANEETEVSESDLDHPNQPVFVDVGLLGNTEMALDNGMCIFSGIKFRSTSFNHEGSRFFLAVCIFQQQSCPDGEYVDKLPKVGLPAPGHPRVLYCKASPPVLVNSRKMGSRDAARKCTLKSLFVPFDTQQLTESLFIRSNKGAYENFEAQNDPDAEESMPDASRNDASHEMSRGQAHWEARIGADITSLVNYFCAQNIRSKIRHPLFLALKFNQCITIHFNPHVVDTTDQYAVALQLHADLQGIEDSELRVHHMIQFEYN